MAIFYLYTNICILQKLVSYQLDNKIWGELFAHTVCIKTWSKPFFQTNRCEVGFDTITDLNNLGCQATSQKLSYITRKKVCASWRFESWLEICAGSIYHVHFAWQVWHGQLSPRFKFNKLKSFSGVEIDQNHVDKRILGGKGLQYKGQEA